MKRLRSIGLLHPIGKVVNPGSFQVSPARVEPMYQPGVMATTESRRVEVKQ